MGLLHQAVHERGLAVVQVADQGHVSGNKTTVETDAFKQTILNYSIALKVQLACTRQAKLFTKPILLEWATISEQIWVTSIELELCQSI